MSYSLAWNQSTTDRNAKLVGKIVCIFRHEAKENRGSTVLTFLYNWSHLYLLRLYKNITFWNKIESDIYLWYNLYTRSEAIKYDITCFFCRRVSGCLESRFHSLSSPSIPLHLCGIIALIEVKYLKKTVEMSNR